MILGLHYAPEPSGNAPYTTSLAQGLTDLGHSVHVFTGFPHYPSWSVPSEYKGWTIRESISGVPVTRLRHHVPARPTALSRLHMELSFGMRLLTTRWGKPDVVIAVSPALFSTGVAMLRARLGWKRPPVGIWVQDLYSRGIVETGGKPGLFSKLALWVESQVLRSATGVVAIHERFAEYAVESLRAPADSVRVIRNWTHLPEVSLADPSATRSRLGWGDDEIIVLHSGNMGKKQGLENVVEAAKYAEAIGSHVKFVLMGDGNQREFLEQKSGGTTQLSFVDSLPQSEFQAALQAANVLLVNELPGVKDMSVPSKLTSYFTSGTPVLAATDPASVTAQEIMTSGAGIRINAGEPQALVLAAESLAADEALSHQLATNGLLFCNETLSKTSAIAHYDDFILTLAESRGV
ncbi:glycosyltransferase family 4 protein [Paenarthrobacter nitroguajacolicus]|uniref:glycosyltransferase family 4 protein n=1 Tax=Paenarthrobacter nitroguajacolicus TaxID=211146 RepID=UPI004053972D